MVELLAVVVIVSILVIIIVAPLSGARQRKVLDLGAERLTALLFEAREYTLASKEGDRYGVHVQSDKAVLFKGATYSAGASTNTEVVFDSALELVSISLAGGATDVVFDRLTGKTSQAGSAVLRVKNNPTVQKVITIEQTGVVSF